jgi:hypothetical protein
MSAARANDGRTWGLHGADNPLAFGMADLAIADADGVRSPASAAYPAFDVAGVVQLDASEFPRQTFYGTGLLPRRQVTHPQELAVDWHPANLEVGERNGKVPVTMLLTNRRLVVHAEKFKLPRASRFSLSELALAIYMRRTEQMFWAAHILLESVASVAVDGEQLRIETDLSTENLRARFRLDVRSTTASLIATEMVQAIKDRWREYELPEPLQRLIDDVASSAPFDSPIVRAVGGDVLRPSGDARQRIPNLAAQLDANGAPPARAADPLGSTGGVSGAAYDYDWPPS